MVSEYGVQGLVTLGIEVWNSDLSAVQEFITESGVTFPVLMDGWATSNAYDIANNTLVVIDPDGTVAFVDAFGSTVSYSQINDMMVAIGDVVGPLLESGTVAQVSRQSRGEPITLRATADAAAFTLDRDGVVRLSAFTLKGRRAGVPVDRFMASGDHVAVLPGRWARQRLVLTLEHGGQQTSGVSP